ncbi:MAG: hypothetical protein FWC03_09710 [Treponema sp.]|nr:hypothetical protein [Treponema sp.]
MNKQRFVLFLLTVAALSFTQKISALDIEITGKEIEVYYKNEYNRSFSYYGELSAAGCLELNNSFTVKSGFSAGFAQGITDIKIFTNTGIEPFEIIPLKFSLAWNYNGLPEYEAHTHTIQPVISYNTDRAGIAAGVSLRFSSFYGESALFESILSFSVYYNFINNESLRIGISCANFNDFSAGNMGSYSLAVNSEVNINSNWSIINDIELMQSGSVGLSSNFYGIAWRTGAKLTW